MTFPPLPNDWEGTRATLHAHAAIAGTVARSHASPHPKWWHVSLAVTEHGLVTDPMRLPDGRVLTIAIDPRHDALVLDVDGSPLRDFALSNRPSSVADDVDRALSDLGLPGVSDRSRLHDDPSGTYRPDHATAFWEALTSVAAALEERRAARPGDTGPVQLWPHGFDVAFEWFGTRVVEDDEHGEGEALPAQINLGWYPGGDAYFYSNPWPFDASLTSEELPAPARWHTDGWDGSLLRYADVAGDPSGRSLFAAYADTVFDLARPTLEA